MAHPLFDMHRFRALLHVSAPVGLTEQAHNIAAKKTPINPPTPKDEEEEFRATPYFTPTEADRPAPTSPPEGSDRRCRCRRRRRFPREYSVRGRWKPDVGDDVVDDDNAEDKVSDEEGEVDAIM